MSFAENCMEVKVMLSVIIQDHRDKYLVIHENVGKL